MIFEKKAPLIFKFGTRDRCYARFGWLPVTRILVSGRLPVITGYQNLGLRAVAGYHWLPEFWAQGGYRLPLVTRIWVSGWLPVTTGYQNLGLRVVTGYSWLPEFWSQGGYRLPLVTVGYHLLGISLLLVTTGYKPDLHPPVTGYQLAPY